MFDLETEINRWRTNLTDSTSISASDAAELEDHLRESIGSILAGKVSGEEAFLLAARRLGSTGRLSLEYAKQDPWRPALKRLGWAATGVLGFHILDCCWTLVQNITLRLVPIEPNYRFVVATAVPIAALAAICFGVFLHFRSGRTLEGLRSFFERHPISTITTAAVITLLLTASRTLSFMLLSSVSLQTIGSFATARSWMLLVWGFIAPLAIIMVIGWILSRLSRDRAACLNAFS